MNPSPECRKLVEDLHELTSNEARWEVVDRALDEAFSAGYEAAVSHDHPRPEPQADGA